MVGSSLHPPLFMLPLPTALFSHRARLPFLSKGRSCRAGNPLRKEAGAALIIVLSLLVLVTVMVVAFFGSVATEYGSAKNSSDAESTRQLADSAVQLVMGQIRTATSGTNSTWASQPGLIRTYDNAGEAKKAFSLYSSKAMVRDLAGAAFDPGDDLPKTDWTVNKAIWVDLNAPVQSSSSDIAFPIIDPRAAMTATNGHSTVEGFSYLSTTNVITVQPTTAAEGADARLPMPVRWIYVFRDGSMAIPSGGNGNQATFAAPGPVPTAANPIVGRIAFWTDDETCKLNVNTACGGVPWDVPIGNSGLEMLFARYQPAKNEFSRYPGHPSTVSLAPALWSFLGLSSPNPSLLPTFKITDWNTKVEMDPLPSLTNDAQVFRDKIFPLVPRNTWGGSQMATQPTSAVASGGTAIAAVDSDRLFASVDELLYGPNEGRSARVNPLDLGSSDLADFQSKMGRLRFFLSAVSRAPEVNPFNLPKVCIWPEPDALKKSKANASAYAANTTDLNDSKTRSPLDRLIAFCSTLPYQSSAKNREYAFTRYDATSPTADFDATDVHGTQNNRILYSYLEGLLGQKIPGFGGALTDRYGAKGTQQILTGIYDFIRSNINLVDTSWASPGGPGAAENQDAAKVSRYAYAATLSGTLSQPTVGNGTGQVVPFENPNGTRGSGRFPVLKEVAIEFIAQAANQPPYLGGVTGGAPNPMHPWVAGSPYPTMDMDLGGANQTASTFDPTRPEKFVTHTGLCYLTIPNPVTSAYDLPNPRYPGPSSKFNVRDKNGGLVLTGSNWLPDLALYQTQIQPVLLLNLVNPSAGVPGAQLNFKVRVSNLDNLKVGGVSVFGSGVKTSTVSDFYQYNLGPSVFSPKDFIGTSVIVGDPADQGSTFGFDGGNFKVELLDAAGTQVIQTYNLSFPAATFPTPLLPVPAPFNDRTSKENKMWSTGGPAFPPKQVRDLCPGSFLTFDVLSDLAKKPNYYPSNGTDYTDNACRVTAGAGSPLPSLVLPQWPVSNDYRGKLASDTVRSIECSYGDVRLLSQIKEIKDKDHPVSKRLFLPHRFYFDSKMRAAHSLRDKVRESDFDFVFGSLPGYLTVSGSAAWAASPTNNYSSGSNNRLGKSFWTDAGTDGTIINSNPGDLWNVAKGDDVLKMAYFWNSWRGGGGVWTSGTASTKGPGNPSALWPFTTSSVEFDDTKFNAYKSSNSVLGGLVNFSDIWKQGGDFSSGIPGIPDGPLIGKVDEGNNKSDSRGLYPYFNEGAVTSLVPGGPNLFSANRQVPSPVVLGCLPSGFKTDFDPASPTLDTMIPWRTLLFSPNPVSRNHGALSAVSTGGGMPQAGQAPDFALLDFFWMPVVEPYAISEPFSTAGKVNMNFQIAPFTYIRRDTALRGALRSTLVTAVPDKWMNNKNATGSGSGTLSDMGGASADINYSNFRYPIQCDETLKQFGARFDAGDIFRSASEICSLWLYPDKRSSTDVAPPVWDASAGNIVSWWYDSPGTESKSVTGDNLREKPYAALYPLLTTKSNTFTVHFKVQTLQKTKGGNPAEWVEGRDRVNGEYVGSQTIERYVDATDSNLPDFATQTVGTGPNLGDFYRFRILSAKRFSP